ncbi:NIPSNAP protein [Amycolatopsis marina]|uniref:NIPSNAP protein n=1 Tax=Amycolatopsis marina TaxID=490629 RepID=A0A1I0ZAW0_9PSEU|nr:NIPSNAP family protein [Amycolatopsis marina]SFB22532.1 NIPSNAP protein [Amycolatopsis marina]
MPDAVVELRQYTLRPGRRDDLVELFDREFLESQEAAGMRVIGQFRDLRDPDRFVWLRGFADMATRKSALSGFYGGPVWQANRTAANDTMIDSDDVLLLRPLGDGSGFAELTARPPVGTAKLPDSVVLATVYQLPGPVDAGFRGFFERRVAPVMSASGAVPVAAFETEPAENNFPALPVRTGENVLVWFAVLPGEEAHRAHLAKLESSSDWTAEVLPELIRSLAVAPQQLLLAPTARSVLR